MAKPKDKKKKIEIPEYNLNIPQTVSAKVTVDLGNGKELSLGSTRELDFKETLEEGHESLYAECLKSIMEILNQ